jgi:hypothetical protein
MEEVAVEVMEVNKVVDAHPCSLMDLNESLD